MKNRVVVAIIILCFEIRAGQESVDFTVSGNLAKGGYQVAHAKTVADFKTESLSLKDLVKEVLFDQLYLDNNGEVQSLDALNAMVETAQEREFVDLLIAQSMAMDRDSDDDSYFEEDQINLGSKFDSNDFDIDEDFVGAGIDSPAEGELNLGTKFNQKNRFYIDENALYQNITPEDDRPSTSKLTEWEKSEKRRDEAMLNSLETGDDSWLFSDESF